MSLTHRLTSQCTEKNQLLKPEDWGLFTKYVTQDFDLMGLTPEIKNTNPK